MEEYIWVDDKKYPDVVKERHLIQKLEGMHVKESIVVESMFKKSAAKYKGLTEKLVEEAFPGILE